MSIRPIKRLSQSKPAIEGAGVHLRRAFGFGTTFVYDPIVMNTQDQLRRAFEEIQQGTFLGPGRTE